jgi:hypothetical protein
MKNMNKAVAAGAATASIDEQLTSKLDPNDNSNVGPGKATNSVEGTAESDWTVQIVKLRRLCGVLLPWRMILAGSNVELSLSSRELLCASAFRKRALTLTGLLLPPLGTQEWLQIVGDALRRVEVIEHEDRSCLA